MLKRLSILLALLFILPVQAGEYEKALEQNEKVFLYLYSSNCSYCIKFEPIYKKIVSEYGNDFKFIKIKFNSCCTKCTFFYIKEQHCERDKTTFGDGFFKIIGERLFVMLFFLC